MGGPTPQSCAARIFAFIAWVLHPLFSRILLETDDETQRVRKISFSSVAVACLVTMPSHLLSTIFSGEAGHEMYYAWCTIVAATSVGVLAHLLLWKHASDRFCHVALLSWCAGIILVDLHSLSALTFNRGFVVFIIVLDVVILARLSPTFYLGFIALWLVLTETDLLFRYGLLEIPYTVPVSERRAAMCDCDKPPCPTSFADFQRTSVIMIFVFVLDFILTRRFARIAREEKEKVEAAVHTTSRIADCFARFDLDRASDILASADELPDDLAHALGTILDNLTSYKPYLPSAFFMKSGADADIDASVPGWNGAGVAMVFTDIRQSTALWEHSAGAMKAALEVHNRIMRGGIAAHGGYEVKTIGDAFMAAFPSAGAAVRFGLGVQEALAGTVWPEGLGRAGAGARDEHDVLMVRIGVHVGEVSLEVNPATGRYDYFGSTVNKTARVEANGAAGAVTVTPEVMEAVWAAGVLEEVQVVPYADVRFAKGFAAGLRLTALVAGGAKRYMGLVRGYCRAQIEKDDMTSVFGTTSVASAHTLSSAASSTEVTSPTNPSNLSNSGHYHPFRQRTLAMGTIGPSSTMFTGMGTVCIVRLPSPGSLPTLGACLAQGSLSTVVGNFAVVSWGAHRAMADHYKHAVGFVASLRTALALADEPAPAGQGTLEARFHAGLASGLVTSAHVAATAAQRFVTVSGACVDLSLMLCAGAAELGTCALAGSLERNIGVELTAAAVTGVHPRPVDTWRLARCVDRKDRLHSISCESVDGGEVGDEPELEVEATATFEITVHDMLFSSCSDGVEAYSAAYRLRDVQGMRACGQDDAVLKRACRMLEDGRHLPHAFCMQCDVEVSPMLRGAGTPTRTRDGKASTTAFHIAQFAQGLLGV